MDKPLTASGAEFIEDIRQHINDMLTTLYTQKTTTTQAMSVLIGSSVGLLVNTAMLVEGIKEMITHTEYTDFVSNTTTEAIDLIYGDLDKFIAKYKQL